MTNRKPGEGAIIETKVMHWVDRQTDISDRCTNKQTNIYFRQANRHFRQTDISDRQTNKHLFQTGKQTFQTNRHFRQTNKQTFISDRQTDISDKQTFQTDRQTDRHFRQTNITDKHCRHVNDSQAGKRTDLHQADKQTYFMQTDR